MTSTTTAINTAVEMITQRGYKVDNMDMDGDTIIGINDSGKQIVIFTNPVIKFNVDRIKEFINILNKMKQSHCIVIYVDSVTAPTKKMVENSIDIDIEIFTQEEMQYNITKHRLVPKHTLLSSTEAHEFKTKYGIKFPTLMLTDPVCRFYNFQRGDIIRVTRKNDRGTNIMYRIVKG